MKKTLLLLVALSTINMLYAQNLQKGMEAWHNISAGLPPTQVEAPDDWFGIDSLMFTVGPIIGGTNLKAHLKKDNDAHSGSFAAKVMTVNQGTSLGIIPGILANAKINIDIFNFDPNNPAASLSYVGGTAVNKRYNYISSWVKYFPKGIDKAQIVVTMVLAGKGAGGKDSIVGQGDSIISMQLSSYTNIDVPITYNDPNVVPDKMLLIFLSSTSITASSPTDSSTLYVDDVELRVHPTSINSVLNDGDVSLYPNPVSDKIYLNTSLSSNLRWMAYTIDGKLISEKQFLRSTVVDIASVPAGAYFYTISNEDGRLLYNSKFTVVK